MSVAVLITCFNEGAYVEAAFDSVLAQTASDEIDEILLVDDGSGAPTLQALDRLEGRDGRLRIIRGPGGWGVSKARNQAAAHTRAPLIAFLDGDDAWAADKLARQLAAMADADLVYTGYEALPDGAEAGRATPVYDLSRCAQPARRYFLRDPPILPSSVLVRRSAFEAAGGFDEAARVFEDTEFFLRLARTARLKGLAEPLIRKRYRADSLSAPRPELMAHHAYAAFRAAALDPALAPLVRRRLAERAARLGLVAYYRDDLEAARRQAALARALHPLNGRTLALSALLAGGRPLRRALDRRLEGRNRLHGR